MKTIYSVAMTAALAVFSVSLGQAASTPTENSQQEQARRMLAQIDAWSGSILDTADQVQRRALSPVDLSSSQIDGLNLVKEDVNRIGNDLRVLESEQGSLTGWESKSIAAVMPLMQEIATNTDKAIETINADRYHLWATAFPNEAGTVYQDARKVKQLLDRNLKLAAVREEEQLLASKVEASR